MEFSNRRPELGSSSALAQLHYLGGVPVCLRQISHLENGSISTCLIMNMQ